MCSDNISFCCNFQLTHVVPVGLSKVVTIQFVSPDLKVVIPVARVSEHLGGGPLEDHLVPQGHCVPGGEDMIIGHNLDIN